MTWPTEVPDREVYRGDPYVWRIPFVDIHAAPINLTGNTFTATIDDPTVHWTLDVTGLAAGILTLSLTDADTTALTDRFSDFDISAIGSRWPVGQTLLTGRLSAKQRAVAGVEI